jgi:hypothetical protein
MATPNLTFNLLTFTHPQKSLTFWFPIINLQNLSLETGL